MSSKIQILNSSAWIDIMPVKPTAGGMLNVSIVANVLPSQSGILRIEKRNPQGINPQVLLLDIILGNEKIIVPNPQGAKYSESLQETGQYTSIELFYEGNLETSINDIPIVT